MDTGDSRPAWTPSLAFWNTVGTVLGAVVGFVAITISLVALLK